MSTLPAAPNHAAPVLADEFIELVCADEQLLRAEFDAIIAEAWSTPPPSPRSAAGASASRPDRRERATWAPGDRPRGPRHPGAAEWSRQRSPPGPEPAPTRPEGTRGQKVGGRPAHAMHIQDSRLGRVQVTAPDASRATPTPQRRTVRGPGEANHHFHSRGDRAHSPQRPIRHLGRDPERDPGADPARLSHLDAAEPPRHQPSTRLGAGRSRKRQTPADHRRQRDPGGPSPSRRVRPRHHPTPPQHLTPGLPPGALARRFTDRPADPSRPGALARRTELDHMRGRRALTSEADAD